MKLAFFNDFRLGVVKGDGIVDITAEVADVPQTGPHNLITTLIGDFARYRGRIEAAVAEEWIAADKSGQRFFPHEFMFKILRSGKLKKMYQIDPKNSWMRAACEKNLPIIVPGWEDATLGNMFAGRVITGEIKNVHTVRTGIEYMTVLAEWYTKTAKLLKNGEGSIGFFQIGGGIAGDFPICVVPMLHQDLGRREVPLWGDFSQISDRSSVDL